MRNMPSDINILYIHGMGGGGDSRIPAILKQNINDFIPKDSGIYINVVVRTYDFDPEVARTQIAGWVEELRPALIAGESLGALNAIRIEGLPHILVSPSLNAPLYLGYLAFLALIPGMTWILDMIYRPKPGDRQRLHFTFRTLRHYREGLFLCFFRGVRPLLQKQDRVQGYVVQILQQGFIRDISGNAFYGRGICAVEACPEDSVCPGH